MAYRTKTEEFDIEVEAALEKALVDFDFDIEDEEQQEVREVAAIISETEINEEMFLSKKKDTKDTTEKKKTLLPCLSSSSSLKTNKTKDDENGFTGECEHKNSSNIKIEKKRNDEKLVENNLKPSNSVNKWDRNRIDNLSVPKGHKDKLSKKLQQKETDLLFIVNSIRKYFLNSSLHWITVGLSMLWTIGGIIVASKLSSKEGSFSDFFGSPQGAFVIVSTIVPVMMFWGFTQLACRTRELRQIIENMVGAVNRMMEPESESEGRVAGLGHTIRREIAAMEIGIDRTISRAGELETLLQSEIQNLEQAYNENGIRIRSLISELTNERESILAHADQVQTRIISIKDKLAREFNSIAEHISVTAESFTVSLSKTLCIKWSELIDEFNKVNENVAQKLAEKLVEVFQGIDNSQRNFFAELDNRFFMIDQNTENVSKIIAERLDTKVDDFVKVIHELTKDIETDFNVLIERLANDGKKIIETISENVAGIENCSSAVDQRLRFSVDKVLEDFDRTFQELNRVIIDRGNQSLTNFTEQVNALKCQANALPEIFDAVSLKAISNFSQKINEMEKQFGLLSERLGQNEDKISQQFINSLSELEKQAGNIESFIIRNIEKVLKTFKTELGKVNLDFSKQSDQSLFNFKEQVVKLEHYANKLSSNFDTASNIAIQAFEKRLDLIDESLNQHSTSFINSFIARAEVLDENARKLDSALEVHISRINEVSQQRIRDFSKTFFGGKKDILSTIDDAKEFLSEEMESICQIVRELFDKGSRSFINQFTDGKVRFTNTLANESARIVESVTNQVDVLSCHLSEVEDVLSRRVIALEEGAREYLDSLDRKTTNFEKSINRNFSFARELIETQARNLDVRADALRDSLNINSEVLNKMLGEQTRELEKRATSMRDFISENNTYFEELLGNQVSLFQKTIEANDKTLKQIFAEHIKNYEEKNQILKQTFLGNQESWSRTIEKQIDLFKNSLLHDRTDLRKILYDHAILISDKVVELQNGLLRTLKEANDILETQGQRLSSHVIDLRKVIDHTNVVLTETFKQQTAVIDERTETLQKALEIGTGNIGNNVVAFSNSLQEKFLKVLSTLDEEAKRAEENLLSAALSAKDSFAYVVEDANKKVIEYSSDLQSQFGQTIHQLDNNLMKIEDRLLTVTSSLTEDTHKVKIILSEAGINLSDNLIKTTQEVKEHFEKHGEIIQKVILHVVENLSSEVCKAESTVTSVGANLVNCVVEKALDVEKKLEDRSFSIQQKLQNMNKVVGTNLEVIGERITEITQNTAHLLVKETEDLHVVLEQLKNIAVKNSDFLRMLSNEFGNQLRELTRTAEERLRSDELLTIAKKEKIRQAGEGIREELERTKADISHGVKTFPDQVKSHTEAMRKDFSEQRTVLKELSNSVEEKSSLFLNEACKLKLMKMKQEKNECIIPEKTTALEVISVKKNDMVESSDLLTHESRTVAKELKGTNVEGFLQSMAGDIIRSINHDAVVSLWQHYRHRQCNIRIEQLYTSKGYELFAAVKHRYSLDEDFRRAVCHYIADFEHLLRNISKNSGDSDTVRDYLSSDTGKVYTLLAHASGRIQ